jgi:hypothetical protein
MLCRFVTLPFAAAAVFMWSSMAFGQQQTTQRTPWHRSMVLTHQHENPPGHTSGTGHGVAVLPSGFLGVVEHISARCVAPAGLPLVYGEIIVHGNPANPGQSGVAGRVQEVDVASHPLLFQTAFSGSPKVYVASQQVKIRVAPPSAGVSFNVFFTSESGQPATATCSVSISGYAEKQ